jgi:hypothetical protein
MSKENRICRGGLYGLSNNRYNSVLVLPLDGEGLGGGDHPPLVPLPSREGKRVV